MSAPRPFLIPFSPVYAAGVAVRNLFFDTGLMRVERMSVPVISVGNITVGGTGKTPFVEMLARRLTQRGRKVAIISRGYKRKSQGTLVVSNGSVQCAVAWESGDEPAQMAMKLKGVVVVVDERRARGASYAIKQFGVDVVILDDGFQHRHIRRDADIVVIPADEAVEPGWILPAGKRREPLAALRRATLIAISRCETVADFDLATATIRQWTQKPVVGLSTRVSAFRRANTRFSIDLAGLKGKSAVAFSGVGNPLQFEKTLRSLGLELRQQRVYPDHHFYSKAELADLERSLKEHGADVLVTTEKDVARLGTGKDPEKSFVDSSPLFYAEIEQSVVSGDSTIQELLDRF